MSRITFDLRQKPPPIQTQLSRSSITRYERSPYPRFSHCDSVPASPPDSEPDSLVSTIDAERRIYYLNDKARDYMALEIASDILKQSFPASKVTTELTYSIFTVNEKWELHRSSVKPPHHSARNLVHAYRIYAEFQSGGPEIAELDALEPLIRARCGDCGMRDVAIEFALLGEDRTVSAWYPPKPDKEKLRAFFGRNEPDGSA
ncbi:hypothetical protein CIB48_g185 [Xylaria polymorpha]|nr:hypothetical protein CIB48_g185 [Xylaria polymorpha]